MVHDTQGLCKRWNFSRVTSSSVIEHGTFG
jgi:hypothetical protein